MQGKIIKGIAGFYYVHVVEFGIYECKAKGIFRKQNIKPFVGDNVEIAVIDEVEKKGNIVAINERMNQLTRPAVSNVDQALVIFAAARPKPNFNLLDRFLLMMEKQEVPTVICFNKKDLIGDEQVAYLQEIYRESSYQVIFASAEEEEGLDEILGAIRHKTTTVAGPSGVGKSSLINLLQPNVEMETNEISKKIERGKHTTRHSQLIHISEDTYIMDTPGFSSLAVTNCEKEELQSYFKEFEKYEPFCKFQGCSHIHEPECGIKDALKEDKINKIRYKNYIDIYNELKDQRKY